MGIYKTADMNEIKKLTYLDLSAIDDRYVPLFPFLNDNGKWEIWVPRPNGWVNIRGIPAQSDYFAKQRERETDISFEFLNVMTKHTYWPELVYFIDGIRHDLHNLSAALAKIDLYYELLKEKRPVTLFVATETEYIFMVCRSIFDLLQEVISGFWEKVQLTDPTINKLNLPKTFGKMVMNNNVLMSNEQIKNRYHLPTQLSLFYSESGSFFEKVRGYRDEIVHSGKGFDLIFETDRGFAVDRSSEPFSSFSIWKEEDVLPNNLASLRTIVAHVIYETIGTCERFADVIKKTIMLPRDVAPGYRLFMRGYHTDQLLKLNRILNEEPWWK
jgi:hypothetical protein